MGVLTSSLLPHAIEVGRRTGARFGVAQRGDEAVRVGPAAVEPHHLPRDRIHGHCIGGGLVLAAACDLRVAASDAYFSIPEVDLGIPLAWGGIPRLVREIGPALTKELVMTCRPFTSAEALSAGFLNRAVPADALDQSVEDLVAHLLTKSSLTLRATKRHVDAVTRQMVGLDRSWADADSLVAALRDPESRASAKAYLDRVRKK